MNLFKVDLECYESLLPKIMWSVIIQGSIMYNFVPWKLEVRKREMYVPRHCKFLLFDRSIKGTNKLGGRSLMNEVNHRS